MYVLRNTKPRSRDHCYRGKALNIIYDVCVCILSLLVRNGDRIFCHLWAVWLYNILPHCLIKGTNF